MKHRRLEHHSSLNPLCRQPQWLLLHCCYATRWHLSIVLIGPRWLRWPGQSAEWSLSKKLLCKWARRGKVQQSALITNTGDECTKRRVIKSIILTHFQIIKLKLKLEKPFGFLSILAHFSLNKRSRFSDKTGHKNTASHRFYWGIGSKEQVKRCCQKQGAEERRQCSRWKKEAMKKVHKNRRES